MFITGESYAGMLLLLKIDYDFLSNRIRRDEDKTFIFFFCLHSGHYIPQLAELILQFNNKEKLFNLKGIAVSIFPPISSFQTFLVLIFAR